MGRIFTSDFRLPTSDFPQHSSPTTNRPFLAMWNNAENLIEHCYNPQNQNAIAEFQEEDREENTPILPLLPSHFLLP
ncbi:MAG: hypothetical protein MUD14_04265 [Hydrococcus sp. Prado102]|nr:hypothetical protein [Hydrococcus sp. Prado102]